ncbi:hypothetical protein X265_35510 [Bradyrhizobium guangdongense]|nr:hypothetical protein X265_35510 [Bradyrhizobium guangdongense]
MRQRHRSASAIWHRIIRKQGHSTGRLDGKVAVVAAATSGIGSRTVAVFVAEGAKIVIAGQSMREGESAAASKDVVGWIRRRLRKAQALA